MTDAEFFAAAERVGMSAREASLWIHRGLGDMAQAPITYGDALLRRSEELREGFVDTVAILPDAPVGTITCNNIMQRCVAAWSAAIALDQSNSSHSPM